MQLGKVIGNVVSTVKTGKTEGLALIIVEQLDEKLESLAKYYVCIDTVGSKHGDVVLTCSSSSARFTSQTKDVCTDNSIVAIVDTISSEKKDIYSN